MEDALYRIGKDPGRGRRHFYHPGSHWTSLWIGGHTDLIDQRVGPTIIYVPWAWPYECCIGQCIIEMVANHQIAVSAIGHETAAHQGPVQRIGDHIRSMICA
jgi:hypothetical protein